MNINLPILDFSKINLMKIESPNLSLVHQKNNNHSSSFFPFVDLSVRRANFKIKGVSEYSRNNQLSNYSLNQTIKNSLKIFFC